jgi:hypothetical protein
MSNYQLVSYDANQVVLTTHDGLKKHIPFDPANTSYQEYMQWLAEGNEPLPADEPQENP